MKIKLKQDHSILGEIRPADTVADISDGVAQDLIDRGIAEEISKPKPAKKKADK